MYGEANEFLCIIIGAHLPTIMHQAWLFTQRDLPKHLFTHTITSTLYIAGITRSVADGVIVYNVPLRSVPPDVFTGE